MRTLEFGERAPRSGKTRSMVVFLHGYGADGAVRATEHWRVIFANAHLVAVRGQLSLSTMTEWAGSTFAPNERRAKELSGVLDQLVRLAGALAPLRQQG